MVSSGYQHKFHQAPAPNSSQQPDLSENVRIHAVSLRRIPPKSRALRQICWLTYMADVLEGHLIDLVKHMLHHEVGHFRGAWNLI